MLHFFVAGIYAKYYVLIRTIEHSILGKLIVGIKVRLCKQAAPFKLDRWSFVNEIISIY